MEDAIARSLCSSGQCAVPTFLSRGEAEEWYDARRHSAEARRVPRRTQLYHTLLSWDELSTVLLPHYGRLPTRSPRPRGSQEEQVSATKIETHMRAILRSAPIYRALPWNCDAFINTLRYLFIHARSAIFVAVRAGRVAAFLPFANREYTNTWSAKLRFPGGMTAEDYMHDKARVLRKPVEAVLHPAAWWMNGGILCNVMPATYWGDAYLAALRSMLDATCSRHAVPDVDFFINKRDYPVLKREAGREPYARFTGDTALCRESYSTYLPVTSFYTGTETADLPMPLTEDWCAATGGSFPGSPYSAPGPSGLAGDAVASFSERKPVAVFRGSATGEGVDKETNRRVRLVLFADPLLVDAGIVAYNSSRDKIVCATPDAIHVDFRRRHALDPPVVPYMSLQQQFSTFRYVIYIDGHAAASRYGTLMHSGCVILKISSDHAEDAGHLWMFPELTGCTPARPDPEADHMVIDATFSNLHETITFLNENVEFAEKVAANAKRRAPTTESITSYWKGLLTAMHDATTATPELLVDGRENAAATWYTHVDRQYARIGKPTVTSWGSSCL